MKKLLLTLGAIASVAAPVAAVVACGATPTKTPTHLDEGFNNASLIENFDMADEAETSTSVNQYSIDGKEYDVTKPSELEAFVKQWSDLVKDDDAIISSFDQYLHYVPGIKKIRPFAEVKNGKVSFKFIDENDVEIATDLGQKALQDTNIADFLENSGVLVSTPPYKAWMTAHKFAAESTTVVSEPVKKDSINDILYSQANQLTNTIKTNADKASIDGAAIYKRASGLDFDLNKYKKISDADISRMPLAANFHKGDKVKFTFDHEGDIASFFDRVKFLDTSTSNWGKLKDTLSETKSDIEYKVIETTDGKGFEIAGFRNNKKWLTLVPTAKNEITLTFEYDLEPGVDYIGIIFGLTGFKDINGDGKIDHLDEAMTNGIVTDTARRLSSSYKSLVMKPTFIYGYVDATDIK